MDEITRRRIERLRRDLDAAELMPEQANPEAVARLREELQRLARAGPAQRATQLRTAARTAR